MHIKWPSIESFHNVRRAIAKYPHICKDNFRVTYRGKTKLHGTNSAIQVVPKLPDTEVLAQSRTRIITPEIDNCGFAAWVQETRDCWKTIDWDAIRGAAKHLASGEVESVCYFGEFIGKGIQKGTAVNKIDRKVLAIFGIMILVEGEGLPIFLGDPSNIRMLVPKVPDTYVLPFLGDEVIIDYTKNVDELQETVDFLNDRVKEVEACDPWVKETFGIEGLGEGIVYYPISAEHIGRESFGDLSFKAKGEKHKVVKQKKAVQVDPETATSVAEFVELVLTEARLEQGVTEGCDGECETKKIGFFIGWACKDVSKECQAELEASGLAWKQVSKAVSAKARTWYMQKISTT